MDEIYLKIKGENAYLYRAVDSQGKTIDFFVSEHRDKDAAEKSFKKALQAIHNQQPRVITTDKYAATILGDGHTAYEFDFIGGEPLVPRPVPYLLFTTTNGTLLDNDRKAWFEKHKNQFCLGIPLLNLWFWCKN